MKLRNLVLACSLAWPAANALAVPQDAPIEPVMKPAAQQPVTRGAHLGVMVRTVPPALAAQLPATVPQGQGVLVVRVQPGSPAAAAGLQPYDILLSYDDQKLFSADQLAALVAADQPGRSVRLKLVRGGQVQEIQAKLAQGAPQRASHPHRWHGPFSLPQRRLPTWGGTVTESFESLSVQKLADGRYKASIEYLDQDGTKQRYDFEGTREELRKQISRADQLPPIARKQLLNALNLKSPWQMPGFWGPMNFEDLFRTWEEGGWLQY